MTAATIATIIDSLPESVVNTLLRGPKSIGAREQEADDIDVKKFVLLYRELNLGWLIARELANRRLPFPAYLQGRDLWLWRAYLSLRMPGKCKDPVITAVKAIACTERMKDTKRILDALLLSADSNINSIAQSMGLPRQVVDCYETLHFNILDRRDEYDFVRNKVYPRTRQVEMLENYIHSEELGALLSRAGYNNSMDDTLYFAGFKSDMLSQGSGADMAARLEQLVMANGYIMFRNGWANQYNDAAGLRRATGLIQASKQGGEQTELSSPFDNLSYAGQLIDEMLRYSKKEYLERIQKEKEIIEAEVSK